MKPLILMSLLFLAIFPIAIIAQTDLVAPANDQIVGTAFVQFIFTRDTTADSCSLILNGQTNKTINNVGSGQTIIGRDIGDGKHNWAIKCSTNSGDEVSQTRQFRVDTKPPIVQLLLPPDQDRIGSNEFEITYVPMDENINQCSLFSNLNNQFSALLVDNFPVSNAYNTFDAVFPDGTYIWNILCNDKANNEMTSTISRSITIDTKPPKITSTSPANTINTKSNTLFATTDEAATCKLSSAQNVSYEDKKLFDITGRVTHSIFLSDLGDGIFDYYISCRDDLGNELQNHKVQIDVHLLPTGKVKLDSNSPIKAGIIEVELITSKKMANPPQLSYVLEGGSEKEIALTGENNVWRGQILITEDSGKKLGVFNFRGTDSKGFLGTVITEGKTFIIDTIRPKSVQNLEGQTVLGKPIINWYSPDEDIEVFNIYRKSTAGVGFTNLYASTNDSSFTDKITSDKATYYYRIAGIDGAGNIGPMSEEIFVTALTNSGSVSNTAEPEEVTIKPLPPNLVYLVNDQVSVLNSRKQTVENAVLILEELSGEEAEISKDLSLIQKAKDAANSIDLLIKEAEKLKERYQSDSELNSKLENLDLESKKIERSVIKSITVEQKTEFESIPEEANLKIGADILLESFGVNDQQKERYIKLTKKDSENFKILSKIVIISLEYVNGQTDKNTIVTRSISYQDTEELQDVVLLEIIPKLVAQSTDEIRYISGQPETLNSGVIKWGFLTLGYEDQVVKYIIEKSVDLSDVKQIQIIPFSRLSDIATIPSSATGFAIFPDIEAGTLWPIFAILALVAVLLAYYYTPSLPFMQTKQFTVIRNDQIKEINRKFSILPIGIDEKIYPTVMRVNEAMIQNSSLRGLGLVNELLESGIYYAMLGETTKAKAAYDSIRLIYSNLNQMEKAQISSRCAELRTKLSNQK